MGVTPVNSGAHKLDRYADRDVKEHSHMAAERRRHVLAGMMLKERTADQAPRVGHQHWQITAEMTPAVAGLWRCAV